MLHFKCPQCDKALRVPEDKAGSHVKCPSCGNRFIVPDAAQEAAPPQMEELQPQAKGLYEDEPPRRRKKSRRSGDSAAAARGKQLVLIFGCVALLIHVVGFVQFALSPTFSENVDAAAANRGQPLTDQEKAQIQSLQGIASSMKIGSIVVMIVGFALHMGLLYFLYLGNNWARITYAVVGFVFAFCCLLGLGAQAVGTTVQPQRGTLAVLGIVWAVLCEAYDLTAAITMLVSKSIKAHTGA